jgi:hypothetical protein
MPTPACAPLRLGLSANAAASIGQAQFALVASRVGANQAGLVALSPWAAYVPFADLTILVDLGSAVVVPVSADRHGSALLPLPLPPDQGLVGRVVFAQAFSFVACGAVGLGASQGLRIEIGR